MYIKLNNLYRVVTFLLFLLILDLNRSNNKNIILNQERLRPRMPVNALLNDIYWVCPALKFKSPSIVTTFEER